MKFPIVDTVAATLSISLTQMTISHLSEHIYYYIVDEW